MDSATARHLIEHAVRTTEPRWSQYSERWADIDTTFIRRGYEQQGFRSHKFLPLLERRGCLSIDSLGQIILETDRRKYERAYCGGLTTPFYVELRDGDRGQVGRDFHDAVTEFMESVVGGKGASFWRLMWLLLRACHYLRDHHQASFRQYLLDRVGGFLNRETLSDEELLSIGADTWTVFLSKTKPWKPLPGIGPNIFDYLLGDIEEARFAQSLYKLDDANLHFLRVTGIEDLIGTLDRRNVVPFLQNLGTGWTLRELNKGLYTYCSITEAVNFGFCRSARDCDRCDVSASCAQRLGTHDKRSECKLMPGAPEE